jgi:alpha/beta superfamily hydrolase
LAWANANTIDILWRAKAGHFFHGQLIWLRRAALLVLS